MASATVLSTAIAATTAVAAAVYPHFIRKEGKEVSGLSGLSGPIHFVYEDLRILPLLLPEDMIVTKTPWVWHVLRRVDLIRSCKINLESLAERQFLTSLAEYGMSQITNDPEKEIEGGLSTISAMLTMSKKYKIVLQLSSMSNSNHKLFVHIDSQNPTVTRIIFMDHSGAGSSEIFVKFYDVNGVETVPLATSIASATSVIGTESKDAKEAETSKNAILNGKRMRDDESVDDSDQRDNGNNGNKKRKTGEDDNNDNNDVQSNVPKKKRTYKKKSTKPVKPKSPAGKKAIKKLKKEVRKMKMASASTSVAGSASASAALEKVKERCKSAAAGKIKMRQMQRVRRTKLSELLFPNGANASATVLTLVPMTALEVNYVDLMSKLPVEEVELLLNVCKEFLKDQKID